MSSHASHSSRPTRHRAGHRAFKTGATDKAGLRVLRVICARDGREHLVNDTQMDAGHAGSRVALCGHQVQPAILICPPGPPCSGCTAVRWQHTGVRDPAARHPGRHRRAGLLARLVFRLRSQPHSPDPIFHQLAPMRSTAGVP